MPKNELKRLLKQHFGFDAFRPNQEEAIERIMQKKDSFILMPTGGGKSLCYQLPALHFDGLTVVISPLIALMKDQVDALRLNGIQAELINSSLTPNEIEAVKLRAKQGELKLLYVAPERFAQSDFRQFLDSLNLSLIAIDEAHCISEWGHDFRPEYRNLSQLREFFPNIPIIALTATATTQVQQDIISQLKLRDCRSFVSSFDRPNLKFSVLQKKDTFSKLLHFLEKYKGESAIIYCFSRKDTEKLAMQIQSSGYRVEPYHAGLSAERRKDTQEKFIRDDLKIITATIAFGMGIDKSNIRLVVHYSFPKSIEGYYQEVGRAGRDSLPSECVTFFGYQDRFNQEFFINKIEDDTLRRNAQQKLQQVISYCSGNHCRRGYLLEYFNEKQIRANCQNCDNCTGKQDALDFQGMNTERKSHPQRIKTQLPFHIELFEKLRRLRKQLADERGVPPYLIFSDVSLQAMAYYLPANEENLIKIEGVGEKKLKQFGEKFLSQIGNFIHQAGEASVAIPFQIKPRAKEAGHRCDADRYQMTKMMLRKKQSLDEIAKAQGFKPGTIVNHIEKLLEGGDEVDFEYLKPSKDRFEAMKWAFEKCGDELLKPAFEHLQEKYSYDEIRLARLIFRQEKLK